LAGMCTANGTCLSATMPCPQGCNSAGTDCATCPPGQTSCPAGCRDLTRDVMNCGGCGTVCPAPGANTGIPVCINSNCDVSCNPGYLECTPASLAICERSSWDFEDATIEGFRVLNTAPAIGKLTATTAQAHTGKYSLGALVNASGSTRGYQVGPIVCAGRGAVQGKALTVTAWMMLSPTVGTNPTLGRAAYFGIHIVSESGDTLIKGSPRGYNEWFPISAPLHAGDTQITSFWLEGVFATDLLPAGDWTGALYIDDVTIQ